MTSSRRRPTSDRVAVADRAVGRHRDAVDVVGAGHRGRAGGADDRLERLPVVAVPVGGDDVAERLPPTSRSRTSALVGRVDQQLLVGAAARSR